MAAMREIAVLRGKVAPVHEILIFAHEAQTHWDSLGFVLIPLGKLGFTWILFTKRPQVNENMY